MPRYPSDALFVIDAVLEGEKHRVRLDQLTNALRCGFGVVGLDAEKDKVDGSYLSRAVRGFYRQREISGKPGLHGKTPRVVLPG